MSATPSHFAARLLLVAGALCLAAAAAVVGLAWQADLHRQQHALEAYARGLASAEDPASRLDASAFGLTGVAVLDARGETRARRGASAALAEGMALRMGTAGASTRQRWQGEGHAVATAPLPGGGTLAVARPLRPPQVLRTGLAALAVALAAWGVLAALAVALVRRPPLDPRVVDLAERVLERPIAPEEASAYGPQGGPVLRLGKRLAEVRAEREGARALLNAALHLGGHYTVVCTLDGEARDASPSFLARTGLSLDALREPGALDRVLPLDTLLALAHRSLLEEAALSGVPAELAAPDGVRALSVSLRAVATPQGPLVLLSAVDRAREDDLERQIDAFSDSIELMVDQRVAQLASGHRRLEEAVESAGLAVFEFSREGATERLNAVAERLTGRTVFTLRQFGQVAAALCPDGRSREAFQAWFWKGDTAPFLLEVAAPGGPRRVLWYAGVWRRAGESVGRVLFGGAVPSDYPRDVAAVHPEDPLQRLHAAVRQLDAADLDPNAHAYVEVVREAARRLEMGGDGAAIQPGYRSGQLSRS